VLVVRVVWKVCTPLQSESTDVRCRVASDQALDRLSLPEQFYTNGSLDVVS